MANPQKEHGYIAIANEILRALAKTRLSGESRSVLDVIFCKTYGFNKKRDRISISQFMLLTGLTERNVCRCLKRLKEQRLIFQFREVNGSSYELNKNYEEWQPLSKKTDVKKDSCQKEQLSGKTAAFIPQKPLSKKADTKDSRQKTVLSAIADDTKSRISAHTISVINEPSAEELTAIANGAGFEEKPRKKTRFKPPRPPAGSFESDAESESHLSVRQEKIDFFEYFCKSLSLFREDRNGNRFYCTTESELVKNTLVKQIMNENTLEEAKRKVDWFVEKAKKDKWLSSNACLKLFIRELPLYHREKKPAKKEVAPKKDEERADSKWIEEERKRIAEEKEREMDELFGKK